MAACRCSVAHGRAVWIGVARVWFPDSRSDSLRIETRLDLANLVGGDRAR